MLRTRYALAAWLLAVPALAQDNIMLVIADDFGVDNVSAYGVGNSQPSTPTIDGLIAEGLTFRNAWSNPLCSPSRACMQTGRYSYRTGIGDLVLKTGPAMSLDEVTLPEMLQIGSGDAWDTALFGKWHLGNVSVGGDLNANMQGYDHFVGTIEGAVRDYYEWDKITNGVKTIETTYATTELVDDALTWLATAQEPYFIVVSFHAPHGPFQAPPANLHSVDLTGSNPLTNPRPIYEAMVEAMDTELGRLLTQMDPGKLSRTNVVFLGDNGTPEVCAVPPFTPTTSKLSLFQGGIQVPFVVAGPAVTRKGEFEDAMVHVVDIFPTVGKLALVNAKGTLPAGTVMDGISLTPWFKTHPFQIALPIRDSILTGRFLPILSAHPTYVGWAIRDKRYKLIVDPNLGVEHFYDLQSDPFEGDNIIVNGFPSSGALLAYRKLRRELFGTIPYDLDIF